MVRMPKHAPKSRWYERRLRCLGAKFRKPLEPIRAARIVTQALSTRWRHAEHGVWAGEECLASACSRFLLPPRRLDGLRQARALQVELG